MRDLQTARGAPLIDSPDESTTAAAAPPVPDVVPKARRYVRWLVAVAAAVIAVDLATKLWVVEVLADDGSKRILGGHVLLHQSRNTGAAFGIATGGTIIFTAVAIIVIVVIVRTSRRLHSLAWAAVLGLLLGGASGNLIDRLLRAPAPFRGAVVDWIDLGPGKFALFNVADSAIVTGGALAVLLALRGIELDGRHTRD
ncbi:MAG: signal peptidase II [Mycobacteriales bacterium]